MKPESGDCLPRVLWASEIKRMMLFLAAVLIVGAGLFYWADRNVHHGIYWADRLCHEAQTLCDAPWWLLVAATAMIMLALFRQMLKS
jgi:hypothetical protein